MRKTLPLILSVAALALCAVMTLHSLDGIGLVGCSAGSSCDEVLGSRWSLIMGILPVSLLAAGAYLSFIILLLMLDRVPEELRSRVWCIELALSGCFLGSALWFTGVQLFAIGSFCKYCMTAHGLGVVLSISMLVLARKASLRRRSIIISFAAGLVISCCIWGFQMISVQRSYYQQSYFSEQLPDLGEAGFPTMGEGSLTLQLMYDYQCPHCRKLHEAAQELVDRNPEAYRFVLVPTPLSNACNAYIPAGTDHFPGSCDYARLALAVWRLDRNAFPAMDAFLWSDPTPSVEEATAYASGLVGGDELEACLASEQFFADFSLGMELFGRTSVGGRSALPRIVCGQDCIIPEVSDAEALKKMIGEAF